MANSLRVEALRAGYGAVQVLSGISLGVNDGETVALLGTNGNGKSTLMKCIMGIVPLSAGRITAVVDGVEHDLALRAPRSRAILRSASKRSRCWPSAARSSPAV